jgi:serpin B
LVLADAIYFKGQWAAPFQKVATASQPFHLSRSREMDVPLMNRVDDFKYAESGDFQAIELPYTGGKLAMVVLLPRQIDGCEALERTLTPATLAQTLGKLHQQTVNVFLPRYKLESTLELAQILASLGMPDAFDPTKADFSAMDGSKYLYLSTVTHKAWGEVNEEGTEAAAATVVAVLAAGIPEKLPPPPPIFRADHPSYS